MAANGTGLNLLRCEKCGAIDVPPRYFCPRCGSEVLKESPASGLGSIYTYTTIWVAAEAFKQQVPFDVAVVELEEGVKVTARIDRKSQQPLQIGQPVKFSRKNDIGYWFET